MSITDSDDYELDDFQADIFKSFQEKHSILLVKFRNRQRSPLKFVEAFDAFFKELKTMEIWQWPAIEKNVSRLKASAESLRSEYERCLPKAKRQQERNVLWDEIYHPPPPFLPGGELMVIHEKVGLR